MVFSKQSANPFDIFKTKWRALWKRDAMQPPLMLWLLSMPVFAKWWEDDGDYWDDL